MWQNLFLLLFWTILILWHFKKSIKNIWLQRYFFFLEFPTEDLTIFQLFTPKITKTLHEKKLYISFPPHKKQITEWFFLNERTPLFSFKQDKVGVIMVLRSLLLRFYKHTITPSVLRYNWQLFLRTSFGTSMVLH